MKRFYISLFCLAIAAFAFGQVNQSSPSKGAQASEDVTQAPHVVDSDLILAPQVSEVSVEPIPTAPLADRLSGTTTKDSRSNKKSGFQQFLVNRVAKKVMKSPLASISQGHNDDGDSVIGVLLVILLVLVIVLLILKLSPYLWGTLGAILLILLILWLLGVI